MGNMEFKGQLVLHVSRAVLLEELRVEMEEALAVKLASHACETCATQLRNTLKYLKSILGQDIFRWLRKEILQLQIFRSLATKLSLGPVFRVCPPGDNLWTSVEHSLARLAFEAERSASWL